MKFWLQLLQSVGAYWNRQLSIAAKQPSVSVLGANLKDSTLAPEVRFQNTSNEMNRAHGLIGLAPCWRGFVANHQSDRWEKNILWNPG